MASILSVMVAWNPGRATSTGNELLGYDKPGTVKVGPWPDYRGWSDAYALTEGACEAAYHRYSSEERSTRVFMLFGKLIIRDDLDPRVVHKAFLSIDEYKARLSIDTPGAATGLE